MKRTRFINLEVMRKVTTFGSIGLGTSLLVGCSDQPNAVVYRSLDECKSANPNYESQCEFAYQKALKSLYKTAPQYAGLADCEYEFGYGQCIQHSKSDNWIPLMAGFVLAKALDNDRDIDFRYSRPLITSYSPYSDIRDHWMTTDGRTYGSRYNKSVYVSKDSFKKEPPKVTRTISRGGFGSKAKATSSWSSRSSSSGGWGG
ncbi:DUF1190 domain-containing protein [Zooshikella ganghwensis]|uniref:DUF1190 domain-containing protein n=1 Tax=Zooshikella ganghwensis TaxID=202772 RepID=UPI000402BDAD|nr:DUF1190 domain-containing protein [Zooshikella ganghwensis]